MWEEPAHHFLCLFLCQVLSRLPVDFLGEPGAVVYHLLHGHVLRELALLVAVDAVVFIGCAVGIRAEDFTGERHSAALTEFHFHCYL